MKIKLLSTLVFPSSEAEREPETTGCQLKVSYLEGMEKYNLRGRTQTVMVAAP